MCGFRWCFKTASSCHLEAAIISHTRSHAGSSVSPLGDCLAGRRCRRKRDSKTKSLSEMVSLPLISAVLSPSPFIASSWWIAAICPAVTATLHTLNLKPKKHVCRVIWIITLLSKSQNPPKMWNDSVKSPVDLSEPWKQLSQGTETVHIYEPSFILICDRKLLLTTLTRFQLIPVSHL